MRCHPRRLISSQGGSWYTVTKANKTLKLFQPEWNCASSACGESYSLCDISCHCAAPISDLFVCLATDTHHHKWWWGTSVQEAEFRHTGHTPHQPCHALSLRAFARQDCVIEHWYCFLLGWMGNRGMAGCVHSSLLWKGKMTVCGSSHFCSWPCSPLTLTSPPPQRSPRRECGSGAEKVSPLLKQRCGRHLCKEGVPQLWGCHEKKTNKIIRSPHFCRVLIFWKRRESSSSSYFFLSL